VEAGLTRAGYRVIPSRVLVNTVRPGGVLVREEQALLPGYVFLESPGEPDWRVIRQQGDVLKPLAYADGTQALRGRDLAFVRFLEGSGGFLGLSRAVQEGTRIRVLDGPLKAWEGSIIRVNRRRQAAEVRIDGEGIVHTIWLPYEVLAGV